jgi:hypothetical protein
MSDEKGRGLDLTGLERTRPADPLGRRTAWDRHALEDVETFRRRDPADELTITVRGPSATIRAFKQLCRAERRSQAEMLRRMLDSYGEPKP